MLDEPIRQVQANRQFAKKGLLLGMVRIDDEACRQIELGCLLGVPRGGGEPGYIMILAQLVEHPGLGFIVKALLVDVLEELALLLRIHMTIGLGGRDHRANHRQFKGESVSGRSILQPEGTVLRRRQGLRRNLPGIRPLPLLVILPGAIGERANSGRATIGESLATQLPGALAAKQQRNETASRGSACCARKPALVSDSTDLLLQVAATGARTHKLLEQRLRIDHL